MKYLSRLVILFLFISFFGGFLHTQELKAVLNNDDITRFIETFKPMTAELDALGHKFDDEDENEEGDPMAAFANMRAEMKEIMSKDEVLTILKKYDWDEDFLDTYIAVSIGYSYNKVNNELDKLDESEKEMAKPMMDMFLDQFRLMVHKDDLEMLQGHMTALDAVFDE